MTDPSRHPPPVPPSDTATPMHDALTDRVAQLVEERNALSEQARRQAKLIDATDELLASARRQLMVVDAARVAQWEWDVPSGKIQLSTRWDDMVDERVEDNVWDMRGLLALVHPEDVPVVRDAFDQTISGRSDRYVVEHRVKGPEGWIWIESIGLITERDAAGQPLKLTGYNRDITARRELHAQLEQARQQAEESNRAKSEFLANMSHEVRTPLNAIMGLTRLLHQGTMAAEQRHYLELIDGSASSLLALLNDILDLSKIEAGKLVFESIRFDVARWVSDAVAMHAPMAEKKNLKVDIHVAPDVPDMVQGDPGRLRQVVSNLVSNAVKFTERGGIRVSLRVDPVQHDLPPRRIRLVFSVRDTGAGIAPDKQRQIFEAFTQEDASTTRRHGGTGLGLAICSQLVSMMDGTIEVHSRPGQGSAFRFTAVFDDAGADFSVLTEPSSLDAHTVQGMRVLLAEDHAVNELLMRKLLAEMGCSFSVARNGEEAVALWEAQNFDLVLMDVQMPVLSGFDATARIRASEATSPDRPRTPIVALTAHAMAGDREKCLAAGMDAYASKPVSPSVLNLAMLEAVRAARATPVFFESEFNFDLTAESRVATVPVPAPAPAPAPASSNPARDSRAALDREQLVRTMGSDMAAVRELAGVMRDDVALRRRAIRVAVDARDAPRIRQHAHALKGAFSAIFATAAAAAAKALEEAMRRDDWPAVERAAGALEPEMSKVDSELAALLNPKV